MKQMTRMLKGRTTRRKFIKQVAGAAMAAAMLPSIASAQQVDAALIEAAKKEGKGSLYAVTDPAIIQAFVAKFKEKYGIELEVTRLISGALGQRLLSEHESGSPVADVVLDTDKLLQEQMHAKGMFASIDIVPGLAPYAHVKTPFSVIVSHIPYSLIYNKDQIKDPPKTWQDLIDPKWKGRVLTIDPRVGGSPALWHVLMRDTYGEGFIKALGQNATLSPSAVPGIQQIAAGAKAIYAPGIHQVVVGLLDKGAPIGEIFPQPTISSDTSMMIMQKAPHPNIARLLAAFTLSVDGQAVLNKDGFSPINGVPGTLPLPQMATPDFRTIKEKIPGLVQLLGAN